MFRESIEGYLPHVNNYHDPEPVEDDAKGRWCCAVDKKDDEHLGSCAPGFFNFLEVHGSATWNHTEDPTQRKVVFRVSNFNGNRFNGVIQLGDCAILDRSQVLQVRDRLNELLDKMSFDDDRPEPRYSLLYGYDRDSEMGVPVLMRNGEPHMRLDNNEKAYRDSFGAWSEYPMRSMG